MEFAVQFCWGHTAFQTRSTPVHPTPQTPALRIDTRQATSIGDYQMKTRERELEEQPIPFILTKSRLVGKFLQFYYLIRIARCTRWHFA